MNKIDVGEINEEFADPFRADRFLIIHFFYHYYDGWGLVDVNFISFWRMVCHKKFDNHSSNVT